MWETRLSIVDWVYSKTQTLLATLRTQSQLRVGCYVSSEVEHLSLSVGCARNKRQYPTVLQILKLSCWMLDQDMDGLFALDLWVVVVEVLRSTNNTKKPTRFVSQNWERTEFHLNNSKISHPTRLEKKTTVYPKR